jgi:hypothetical protein
MVMGRKDDDVRGGGHYIIFGGAAGGELFYVGAAVGVARRVAGGMIVDGGRSRSFESKRCIVRD